MQRKRIVVDTNVVLDCLWMRPPFAENARKLLICGKVKECELWITPSQVTNLIYILSDGGKRRNMPQVLARLRDLRTFINVCPLGETEIDNMLNTLWNDPEDELIYEAAQRIGADVIITANKKDFPVDEQVVCVMNADEFFSDLEEHCGIVYSEITS